MSRQSNLHRRSFLSYTLVGGGTIATAPLLLSGRAHAEQKTLTVAIPNNPPTFDPINSFNHDAMVVNQTIFENLVQVDLDGNLRPQLATDLPEISDDRKTYTFNLRDDVYFQNGQKFTADDVKYSFEYVLDPNNNVLRRPLFERIKQVVVESPTRVRFEMEKPYRPWLYYMTKYMGIFPKGSREKHGDEYFKISPIGVGTGPGVFDEWVPNDYVLLKKNPDYYRKGIPDWDRLIVRTVPEDTVRVAYLVSGQADIISAPPPKDFEGLNRLPNIQGGSKPTNGGWMFLMLNTIKPPFDDAHFRRAISHAINRKVLASELYYGLVDPSAIPAPPRGWWYSEEANGIADFDMDQARAELAKSKYADGVEFEMMIPAQPYLVPVKDLAAYLQAELTKLNIGIKTRIIEQSRINEALAVGDHVSALQVWMSPGEPTYMIDLIYGKDNVYSKAANYNNPELLETIEQSYLEVDRETLKDVYARMLTILARDVPHVWFGFVHAANLWRDCVENFEVNQGLTMRVAETELHCT